MKESLPQQLSLGVTLNDEATFENYYAVPGSNNAQIVDVIRKQTCGGEFFVYIWGGAGVGVTHLLQAACHEADKKNLQPQYLPLRDLMGFAPDALLEGFESMGLICIDGLHLVAGNPLWEYALFNLFNRVRESGGHLLMAATQGPHELTIQLPDLRSRLSSGVVFQVDTMTDADKQSAMQLRANTRGLELSDEVAQFILHRAPRDMNELFFLLNRLDDASLTEQRKLTIPFVKRVLGF